MAITAEMEMRFSEMDAGAKSFTDGAGQCPRSSTFRGSIHIPDLGAISGDLYEYTIEATDSDGDGRWEAVEITAGRVHEKTGGITLGFTSTGEKFGPWS